MAEMTLDQQKAIAMANARLRMQQASAAPAPEQVASPQEVAQPVAQAPTSYPSIGQSWQNPGAPNRGPINPRTGLPDLREVQKIEQGVHAIKNMGLEAGGAMLGQAIGAPFEAVGGMHIGGAIGGAFGNAAAQLTTPGKDFSLGQVAGAGVTGAIPGASLAKAGAGQVAKQAVKFGAANVAAKNAETLIDTGETASIGENAFALGAGAIAAPLAKYLDAGSRAASAATKSGGDSVTRETIREGQKLGLVVPPAAVRPNAVTNTLQSLGGKASVAQESIIRNQPKVNDAIRAEIGLPASAPLSPIALNTARTGPNLVYDEVSKLTPATGGLLENFKTATAEANMARQAYRDSIDAGRRNPALLEAAQASDAIADSMHAAIKKEAQAVRGGAEIVKRFDEARVKLAKIGLAERAVNKGSGNIDPAVIGQALDAGEKLSGAFKTVGRYENAFGKYLKDAATAQPSGVDYLKFAGKLGMFGTGAALHNPALAVGAPLGMLAAERGAKSLLLSPGYQKRFATPFYGAALEDVPAGLARLGTMTEGRNKN